MKAVEAEKLSQIIADSLSEAIEKNFESNAKKSALFVSKLGKKLSSDPDLIPAGCLPKLITVDEENEKAGKIEGEWLLDIVITKTIPITENNNTVEAVSKLVWAIESESKTSLKEFASDFSKLAVVKSEHYLYLHGFDQQTEGGMNYFFERRLELAKKILMAGDGVPASFFIAFWASPAKPQNDNLKSIESLWDLIVKNDPKFEHLRKIYLYQLTSEEPIKYNAISINLNK